MDLKKKEELQSLNQVLPTLYAEELEKRLETDPLAIGGLLDTDISLLGDCDALNCIGTNTSGGNDCSILNCFGTNG